ncbi:MAG: NAD(+)/NADH kinase [Spirochaetes bacterium]|nr:NAD(+)/NADH kinase [Spirochaetota bacterium]
MITIVMNQDKKCEAAVARMARGLTERGRPFKTVGRFPFEREDREAIRAAEILVIVGGDGTALSTLSQLENLSRPVLPVNFGTLSFINTVHDEEVLALLDGYASGNPEAFVLDERPVLALSARGQTLYAFNEAAFKAREMGRLMTLSTRIQGHPLPDFRGDGIMVATPTGSTAYNLAAGGPILHPATSALILNPICPHSLTVKPIVIPAHHDIEIACRPRNAGEGAVLLVDGNLRLALEDGETVVCRLAKEKLKLLKPAKECYYDILRVKMKWGM